MAGPAVGLWLFEHHRFDNLLPEITPWLETFCESAAIEAGSATASVSETRGVHECQ